jgi:hypothetical protein
MLPKDLLFCYPNKSVCFHAVIVFYMNNAIGFRVATFHVHPKKALFQSIAHFSKYQEF